MNGLLQGSDDVRFQKISELIANELWKIFNFHVLRSDVAFTLVRGYSLIIYTK